jgi:mitogen-activated protein kinase kinase
LIELALGRFPFSEDQASDDSDLEDLQGTLSPGKPMFIAGQKGQKKSKEDKERKRKSIGVSLQGGSRTMSILELLQHIVNEPAPRLTPEGRFPNAAEEFVDGCLFKDPEARKTPKELLVSTPCEVCFVFSADWSVV